jgi:bifunctional DNA-binding transcriptional regulator/antitoxin component of YhaV-PrlF toxin-antitoxin module
MKFESKITSKGTITIAAPLRKELGLRSGQKIHMFVNKNKNIEIDTGIAVEDFIKVRDEILKRVEIPEHLKGLTARELREVAASERPTNERNKSRR